MNDLNLIGLILAYYLSRFNDNALRTLDFSSQSECFKNISNSLKMNPNSLRQMRDEFDSFFDNPRVGYKKALTGSRKKIFDYFEHQNFEEVSIIVIDLLSNLNSPIEISKKIKGIFAMNNFELKNLNDIAKKCKESYQNTFQIKDYYIPDEFKRTYGAYVRKNGQSIDFAQTFAVLTTSTNKKIFIPNIWFVISTYMIDFVCELYKYKDVVSKIKIEDIPSYKNNTTIDTSDIHRKIYNFFENENNVNATLNSELVLKFLTDYNWWYGSKTIDRGDFFVSPVLNLLGVVAASQGFIADITNSYTQEKEVLVEAKKIQTTLTTTSQVNSTEIFSVDRLQGAENVIIYGAPGTGKSRSLEDRYGANSTIKRVIFHPEYTFFDFIGTYKPIPIYKETDDVFKLTNAVPFLQGEPYITYAFTPGPFIDTLVDAWLNPHKMFTLMIEEINRANAAAVFGEMFQLLDRSPEGESEYSISPSIELKNYLMNIDGLESYISGGLKIPSNMSIVATMNSADQGVTALDSAFKRRWKYEYTRINIENAVHKNAKIHYNNSYVDWGILVTAINEKLKNIGIEEDRLLGPYFIKPNEIETRSAIDKLLLYLWDDVLRHQRKYFFSDETKTFCDLVDNFTSDNVLHLSIDFSQTELNITDEIMESDETSEN